MAADEPVGGGSVRPRGFRSDQVQALLSEGWIACGTCGRWKARFSDRDQERAAIDALADHLHRWHTAGLPGPDHEQP